VEQPEDPKASPPARGFTNWFRRLPFMRRMRQER
jgi:hypothetical protein